MLKEVEVEVVLSCARHEGVWKKWRQESILLNLVAR